MTMTQFQQNPMRLICAKRGGSPMSLGAPRLGARQKGFTLAELMVVVAITGILAAIAYPSYTNYVLTANRKAAEGFMLSISSKEQEFFLDSRSYTTTIGSGGLELTTPTEVSSYYTVSVASPSPDDPTNTASYKITATPISGTKQANDGTLTLTQAGVKSPSDKW